MADRLTTGPLVEVSVQGSPRYAMRVITRLPLRGRDDGVALVTIRLPGDEDTARLLAAAPELLAALEAEEEWRGREAVGEIDPDWDYELMVGAKRRAAIAKATGSAQ